MNLRGTLYAALVTARGRRWPGLYRAYLRHDRPEEAAAITRTALRRLLLHARSHVPHYAALLADVPETAIRRDPLAVLARLPVLSRDDLRERFAALTATVGDRATWTLNRSGGSTGEPVRLWQDRGFTERANATSLFFSHLAGREFGRRELRLWGSERDLLEGTAGRRVALANWATGTRYLNAFRMTTAGMRAYLEEIDRRPPRLLIAYAQALYELARFAQSEGIAVRPPGAIITSAGTLYPVMRETITAVFRCPVYNRYGSREVGDIACERPGAAGLWVAPWAAVVEVVDAVGRPVPPGVEGELLVTSLMNDAMPLLRYRIGDRGTLAPSGRSTDAQVLAHVSGRSTDNFRTRDGRIVPGEYFIHMIGVVLNQGDLRRVQVVQRAYDDVLIRLVPGTAPPDTAALVRAVHTVMGEDCAVTVEHVADIPPSPSGKYRYTVSELGDPASEPVTDR